MVNRAAKNRVRDFVHLETELLQSRGGGALFSSSSGQCSLIQSEENYEMFIIRRSAEAFGRILVSIPRDFSETRRAYFGFFDCTEDSRTAGELLSFAQDWARSKGATRLTGPMNFSTWHRYRLVTGGSEEPPFFLEPSNPSYYVSLLEENGFFPIKEYVSRIAVDPTLHIRQSEKAATRFYEKGYSIRPLNKHHFTRELKLLYRLSSKIFSANGEFQLQSEGEFLGQYSALKHLVLPDLFGFSLDPSGRETGFVFGLPDYAPAFRNYRGGSILPLLPAISRIKRRSDRYILKSVGALPGLQPVLTGPVLGHWFHSAVVTRGGRSVIHALMASDNRSLRISLPSTEPYRSYALFSKELMS